ncbi:hypothetical protein SPMU_05940 [Sphingomonas mucosissima]|uniref:Uncharacterized protein n=1 Tax=Sphingomonas mucosissima TaxID=370959 RepID=A0A245ZRA2_9SPHN|nr:hypothetical protein SPMU_05940 [Sphingomonas mucosissima]
MSGEGVIPSDPEIPFGRWQTGRDPRGAARDVCLSLSHLLPREGGAGGVLPTPSFPLAERACPSETRHAFLAEPTR